MGRGIDPAVPPNCGKSIAFALLAAW